MTEGPPLTEGEAVVFDHIPSLKPFKRTARILLLASLVPTIAFLIVFPDTFWPAVPLFVACLLLVQERWTISKYRAWVTNRRVILQGGRDIALGDITKTQTRGSALMITTGITRLRLYYAEDPAAFQAAVDTARKAAP
ncbi:hypothetical protein [Pseudooctadecabacter jejudonensis]|uniref:DUF304 domain-containing protein n=1 Tax=Pseudooctadecabacter jejudonensis TaxID=1391910 RepID=A0A1Y5T197_9RHOB|nr:hypothetical protein [Pseudooctadecabacter jejudonensis]SLN53698.1 hypothetical protein PSJ8397_02797 [Pseudooctadecabacter jejudonensis]